MSNRDFRVRDLTDTDVDAALTLRNRSFGPLGSGGTQWWEIVSAETLGGRWLTVVDGSDRPVAAGRIRPYEQAWGGAHLPMGGVAGVYSDPAVRGHGVASLLMRGLLRRMVELGDSVSALYPTAPQVYRRAGYEFGGWHTKLTYAADDVRALSRAGAGTRVRSATPDDTDQLRHLVQDHHRRHRLSGPILHSPTTWQRALGDSSAITYLALDGDTTVGFVHYRIDERVLEVHDLVATDAAVAADLWGIVGSGSSYCDTVQSFLEPHDPLALRVSSAAKVDMRNWTWMCRVIDLSAAFNARSFSPLLTLAVTVHVEDEILTHNSGTWRLTLEEGTGSVSRASDGGHSCVHLDARGLTALWSGWSVSRLRAAGLASGGTERDDLALDTIFACRPVLTQYF